MMYRALFYTMQHVYDVCMCVCSLVGWRSPETIARASLLPRDGAMPGFHQPGYIIPKHT